MAVRLFAVLLVLLAGPASAGVDVHVANMTKPTLCAENDNVDVRFSGVGISHFTIEARHPAYLTADGVDETAPDFAGCDQSHDPSFPSTPLDLTLYEDRNYRLVGHRFSQFWRPDRVDFRVGATVASGLHLVQLIRKMPGHNVEILVVYPADGYWRIKPLPPEGRTDTAYGSSFLIGPIAEDGRPYVPLSAITFEPATLSFHLAFRAGEGSLRVMEASALRTRVEVTLPAAPPSAAWAVLRSMFVSPAKADMSSVMAVSGSGSPQTSAILDFRATEARTVTFGRSAPSHHNTSAPDLSFGDFAR